MQISKPLASAITSLAAYPPPCLYHYTSAASLVSILDGDALWASHVGFLDDLSEVSHAVAIARDVCTEVAATMSEAHRGLLSDLATQLGHFAEVPVFVASFSESGDLLSQWRAYCKYPGGYAIGLTHAHVQEHAVRQGFALAQCQYDLARQRAILTDLIRAHAEAFTSEEISEQLNAVQGAGSDVPASELLRGPLGDVARVAAFLKHPSFSEEREWRLVSLFSNGKPLFRAGAGRIVPYVGFSLRECASSDGYVSELIVGPSPFAERAKEAARGLLMRRNHGCVPRKSAAPFAMW